MWLTASASHANYWGLVTFTSANLGGMIDQESRAALLEQLKWYRSIEATPHEAHPKEWMEQQLLQLRALGYAE